MVFIHGIHDQPKVTIPNLEQGKPVGEVRGIVKWYDESKKYGFVIPDNGLQDILLPEIVLHHAGFNTTHEGAVVVCEVREKEGGKLFASKIISLDNTLGFVPESRNSRTHVVVQSETDWERAMVKWFNRVRGFGFLTRGEGTPDIFVHMETLRKFGFTELRPGQMVQVRSGGGSKGHMVSEIRPDSST